MGAPVVASLGFHNDKRCVKWAMLQWRASQQRWERGGVTDPKKRHRLRQCKTHRTIIHDHHWETLIETRYQVCCSHKRHPVQICARIAALLRYN